MGQTAGTGRGLAERMRGVTLVELMVAVVIVGILAAVAYPSFQEQVRKTRRADGKAALLETAQRLERCYTRFSRYDDANCSVVGDLPLDSPEGFYQIAASALNASSFTLDATPQGDQVNDTRCGAFRLTHTGQQGSLGSDTDANDCW